MTSNAPSSSWKARSAPWPQKPKRDLQQFADRVENQFAEVRADNKSLREKVDGNFQILLTRIETEGKETREALNELTQMVLRFDSRQSAILWVGGGLVAFVTLAITAGKAFKWF